MPELPDIQAYIRALESRILDQTLHGVRLNTPFVLRTVAPGIGDAAGHKILSIERIGKRIAIGLEGGMFIVVHLMIAGRFQWREKNAKLPGKLALAAFDVETGTLLLTEAGTKRRASIHIVSGRHALEQFHRGGIEPLESTQDQFRQVLSSENHTLKRALTDPRLFSGIGNAYSDEILHRAKLSPVKLTLRLTDSEVETLYESTREVLTEWIERLGAESVVEFPKKVTAFREGMAVHGRYKQPCLVCGGPIQRIVYADNECDYCPTCQTGGKLLADRSLSRLLKSDWPRSISELEELKTKHNPTGRVSDSTL